MERILCTRLDKHLITISPFYNRLMRTLLKEKKARYETQSKVGFPLAKIFERSDVLFLFQSSQLQPFGTNCSNTKKKIRFARRISLVENRPKAAFWLFPKGTSGAQKSLFSRTCRLSTEDEVLLHSALPILFWNNVCKPVNWNKTWNANLVAIFEAKFEGSFSEFLNVWDRSRE